MKRWDCFMFNDEMEMLRLRLEMLDQVVDRFVLCEATYSHTPGPSKPLHFLENREQFAPWLDRIVHVVADEAPFKKDWHESAQVALVRERWQRAHVSVGLDGARSGDLITISDVDEIPDPEAYRELRPGACLEMSWDCFYVGLRNMDRWWGCAAGTAGMDPNQLNLARFYDGGLDRAGPYLDTVRGGWHLSWLGGAERARRKLHQYCHPQYRGTDLTDCVARSEDVYGSRLRRVPVTTDLYPRPLVDRIESGEWRHLACLA